MTISVNIILFSFSDLFQLVSQAGGSDAVNQRKYWSNITRRLGFHSTPSTKIKVIYQKWIEPFEKSMSVSLHDSSLATHLI